MALSNEDLQAIAALIEPIHGRLDKLEGSQQEVKDRLDKLEGSQQEVKDRLDKLESEVSAVKSNQLELKKEVREIKHKVNDTYELALDAWGTSTENRSWLQATH